MRSLGATGPSAPQNLRGSKIQTGAEWDANAPPQHRTDRVTFPQFYFRRGSCGSLGQIARRRRVADQDRSHFGAQRRVVSGSRPPLRQGSESCLISPGAQARQYLHFAKSFSSSLADALPHAPAANSRRSSRTRRQPGKSSTSPLLVRIQVKPWLCQGLQLGKLQFYPSGGRPAPRFPMSRAFAPS